MAELMELTPYDFGKALTFLRKAALPPAVVLHLEQVDDQITEEQAWKSGSPLFEVLMPYPLCDAVAASLFACLLGLFACRESRLCLSVKPLKQCMP